MALAGAAGALGVTLGAIGSHVLREKLSEKSMVTFTIGLKYHLIHSVAMLAAGLHLKRGNDVHINRAYYLWGAGIAMFSGSLYALALGGPRLPFGPITPIGGTSLIAGWLCVLQGSL